MSSDSIPPELRAAEAEIDNAFRSNLLIHVERPTALYHLLIALDDAFFIPLNSWELNVQESRALTDSLINESRFALAWVAAHSPLGDPALPQWDKANFDAAYELLILAKHYEEFAGAFTLASAGQVRLELDGKTLRGHHLLADETRYEAYNRMFGHPVADDPSVPLRQVLPKIARKVTVSGRHFTADLDDALISEARRALAPVVRRRFNFPKDWRFSRYSLEAFKRVHGVLLAESFLHAGARFIAADRQCEGLGVVDSLKIRTRAEWIRFLTRLTRSDRDEIDEIVSDLTYGRWMRTPDPALQPLVPLTGDYLALSPQFFVHLNAERNLAVLLNRIPAEQEIYSRLVNQKEGIVRTRLARAVERAGLRSYSGSLPEAKHLPDIDLAIISDRDRACLLCELKWFIEPAEARELLQKEKEISKGVGQVEALVSAVRSDSALRDKLGIGPDYLIHGAVMSETWVGNTTPATAAIPVIRTRHSEAVLESSIDLRSVIAWLSERRYLPQEGIDYEMVITKHEVAGYTLEWFGLRPLHTEMFMPLPR